jgi:DNA polymerase (family 10)
VSDAKRDVLEMLEELQELTMLDEGDPQAFRVRAYESARHGVEAFGGDLSTMSLAQLQKIEGIGKSTAEKIRSLLDTGRVDKLEVLRQKYPKSVVALLGVPGVGPKAVLRLRKELGVESVDDLKRAVAEHKLRELKGFGPKSEEKYAKSLARMGDLAGRTPISVALPLAERIVAALKEVPGVETAAYCGSLRRFSETVGDIDVVVASLDPEPVMERAATLSMVGEILARGSTKTSFVSKKGIQVDVRVVPPDSLGAALMYFTGSKGHNIKLRQRAIERGWTLSEYALAEQATGKVVASKTEEEVYAALGLAWIHPVQREDAGEIELAASGALPVVIDPATVTSDFHVHTSLSRDARSALEDVVAAAVARGCRVLAITEHAEGLPMAGVGREPLLEQRRRIAALQAEVGGAIRILHGIELNIGKDGELDYDAEFRAGFDFCLASIHDHFDLDREGQTLRVVRAMEDPSVQMIGHLSARMIGARPSVELDIEAILAAAERTGTALEVNGGLPRLDVTLDVMRAGRGRKGVRFVLTSDAHQASELDRVGFAAMHASRAWLDPAQIVSTWSPERVLGWVADKRAHAKP